MNTNLETKLGPILLRNPILASAGPITDRHEKIIRLVDTGVGGIYTKSVCLESKSRDFYMAELKGAFMDSEPCLSIENWLERIKISDSYKYAHSRGVALIVEMDAKSSNDVYEIISKTYPYADGYEIHLSHLKDINDLSHAIRHIKNHGKLASVKLGANDWKVIKDVIQLSVRSGADAIHINNPDFPGLALDLSTQAPLKLINLRPVMGNVVGWVTGSAALRYYVQKNIYDIKQAYPEVGLIGSSGVRSGKEALEMLAIGANAVAICSAAILEGFEAFRRIVTELSKIILELGFSSVDEIIGLLHKRSFRLSSRGFPSIDPNLCTGCRLCEISCPNNAIKVIGDKATLDRTLCLVCGLCYSRCRFGAIRFL